ncbi:MAG: 3-oxoacyl-ACP reductase [Rhodospirillaceae bacterium TMED8]|nr:3-oxoacyl-ACP reductase [Magnetovibrio sp.]OUT49023.1 MAG: 3-oxoacyl-ACP reductase [Rhodospirillaceae bacterium TMED8]|tara:strand:- start:4421 stop:5179 length:759 start_codon:yes stop_codon:yes gene_type:complete
MVDKAKVALITGAGSGIGRASALALLDAGYHVVLAGRRIKSLEETVSKAGAQIPKCLAVATDVSNPKSVESLFRRIREMHGRLDLLFNNAGQGAPGVPFEELLFEQWRQVVDVNLSGSFLCAQNAFKLMKNQVPRGGRIINNGSISAHAPRPDSAPYTSTKHGITGLTKSLSLDGRKYDIAVGQIDIGNTDTEMTERMQQGVKQANGQLEPEAIMNVSNVAEAVVQMAGLPLDTNIQFLTIMATKMPFVGRG